MRDGGPKVAQLSFKKSGLTDEDDDEKHDSEIISIAADIKPKLEQYRVEVVFWGVRDLRKIHLLPITKPKIKLEICGESLQSEPISSTKKTLNFCDPIKYLDVVRFWQLVKQKATRWCF